MILSLRRPSLALTFCGLSFLCPFIACADRITLGAEASWMEQSMRFWTFEDSSLRIIVCGSLLMGLNCGLMGAYVVTRRLSMFGDTLSHAVLPGIAVGFVFTQSRDDWGLLIGATLSGFVGVSVISLLKRATKLKEDGAMALVLSTFYALGICLITHLQKGTDGGSSGLETYLFGQLAGLSTRDLQPMVICLVLLFLCFASLRKELLVCGFDPAYARSLGLPVDLLQFLIWILLAFCIVSALQIIGVVLVSALLIIPAATASLITHKMNRTLILSGLIGSLAGVIGCFVSFLGQGIPAGSVIVLCSTTLFLTVLFLSPVSGLLPKWLSSRKKSRRIRLENTLKACYQVLEDKSFEEDFFDQSSLARRRRKSVAEIEGEVDALIRKGYATTRPRSTAQRHDLPSETILSLTPSGWELACRIIRNHRLWELYLTNQASYSSDHVHDDAEKIEHLIGERTVRQLERILSHPQLDPHGKLIPSQTDIDRGWVSPRN